MRRALLPAAAALALAASPASAAEHVVDMPGKYFEPASTTLLVGDTVTWKNSDRFEHDVAAFDGSFESGLLASGARYSVTFPRSGHVAYRCTIHPFMAGSLDVYSFALHGPAGALSAGRRAVLRGLAPGGVRAVTIEQRRADGTWAVVVTVPVGPDGSFRAAVAPTGPAVYRAVAAGEASLPLPLASARGWTRACGSSRAGARSSARPRGPRRRGRRPRSSSTRASASAGARSPMRASTAIRASPSSSARRAATRLASCC